MAFEAENLHFVLFPLMAQGHMIPMVDIAQLLAKRNILVTIVTTPVNTKRFEPTFSHAIESGLSIHLLLLKFPSQEAGLPEGCENLDMLPSLANEWYKKFFNATAMLKQEFESSIEELNPKPSCIISDMGFPWTVNIAQKLNIPRIIFHGTCVFSLVCFNNMMLSRVRDSVESEFDVFVIPGLPHRIELTKAQLPGPPPPPDANLTPEAREAIFSEFIKSDKATYGTIVNSFTELEPEYLNEYRRIKGGKVWCVGPVSERGNRASIDKHDCLKWLDSQKPGSVIYVCLGSISRLNSAQMIELSLGIEASKRPFIWVARTQSVEFEKWMIEEGYEERNKENGLVIKGWAPQVSILSHPSVGGFFTHCGWNSILEGVTAGLAMITWPMFAEQFVNEKLVVQVLEIGLSVGVKMGIKWGEEEKVGVLVEREIVEKTINELMMDDEEEGEKRRKRARELGEIAKKALEDGGSSHLQMTVFIEDIMHYAEKK